MENDQANQQAKQEQQKIFALVQKNSSYYEAFFRRPSILKEMVLGYVFSICSWPRLVLEVFLRRNMGERYFSMGAVVFIFFVMLLFSWQVSLFGVMVGETKKSFYMSVGLCLFAFVFLFFGVQRNREIKRLPSVFDFERFSLATGETLPFFDRFTTDRRKLATIFEPAACFIVGLVFLLILQWAIAAVLIGCSVIYALSYFAAYHQGDNFLMDQIDKHICDTDLARTYRLNLPYTETRGAEFFGYQPDKPEERERVSTMFGGDTASEVS